MKRCAVMAALVIAAGLDVTGVAQADPAGQMYGDPAGAAQFWRYQHNQDCGLMAVADVVGQVTGREPPQSMIQLRGRFTKSSAHQGAIYRFDGTSPEDLVVMLQQFNIGSQLTTGNSMAGMEQDLAAGHQLIAALNAETIWNTDGDRSQPDHAVVVTGIDTGAKVLHLNDSGIPTGRDEQIPMAVFDQAWSASNNEIIVTT